MTVNLNVNSCSGKLPKAERDVNTYLLVFSVIRGLISGNSRKNHFVGSHYFTFT